MQRMRAKGRTVTVLLDPETYELLTTLQRQLGEKATQAQAITAALRALSPSPLKAKRELTDAETDKIFADIEAAAARARQLRSHS